MSRKKTEYLGCYEHQDVHRDPLTGRDSKESETFTYLGSTLAEDGELDMWKSPTECRLGGRTGRKCLECCATGK